MHLRLRVCVRQAVYVGHHTVITWMAAVEVDLHGLVQPSDVSAVAIVAVPSPH